MPNCGATSEVGRQSGLVRNSTQVQFAAEEHGRRFPEARRRRCAKTNRIALQPHSRMSHSTTGSLRSSTMKARMPATRRDRCVPRRSAARYSWLADGHVAQFDHDLLAILAEDPIEELL